MPYFLYLGYENEPVLFPVMPAKFSLKIENQNKTVNLISEGQVNLLKSPGLTEITIQEIFLPAYEYPFAVYENGFQPAKYFTEKLEQWKNDTKKPIKIIVSRTTPDNQPIFDTNMKVSVEDYEIAEDADTYGFDVVIKNLTLKQYVEWGSKKLEGVVISLAAAKKKRTAAVKAGQKVSSVLVKYAVKKGDTLKSISKSKLYDSKRWKDIYELNKSKIEKAAKAHKRKSSNNGLHIYEGTVLTLPKLV